MTTSSPRGPGGHQDALGIDYLRSFEVLGREGRSERRDLAVLDCDSVRSACGVLVSIEAAEFSGSFHCSPDVPSGRDKAINDNEVVSHLRSNLWTGFEGGKKAERRVIWPTRC